MFDKDQEDNKHSICTEKPEMCQGIDEKSSCTSNGTVLSKKFKRQIITHNFCVASFIFICLLNCICVSFAWYQLGPFCQNPSSFQQCLNCRYLMLHSIKFLARFRCTRPFRSTLSDDKKSLFLSMPSWIKPLPTAMINIPAIPINFHHFRILFTCWLHQTPPFSCSR